MTPHRRTAALGLLVAAGLALAPTSAQADAPTLTAAVTTVAATPLATTPAAGVPEPASSLPAGSVLAEETAPPAEDEAPGLPWTGIAVGGVLGLAVGIAGVIVTKRRERKD